jgi:hypothetical protein
MAYTLQHPETKIPYAPILEGEQGIGKNLIIWLLELALGHNMFKPSLTNFYSNFDAWKQGHKLILVDELEYRQGQETKLNGLISHNNKSSFEGKGVDSKAFHDVINYMFTTNNRDCLKLKLTEDGNDNTRRWLILSTDITGKNTPRIGKASGYHKRMAQYMMSHLDEILAWFYNPELIEDMDDLTRAPMTKGYQVFMMNGLSERERKVSYGLESIEFNDVVSRNTLLDYKFYHMEDMGTRTDLENLGWSKITKILESRFDYVKADKNIYVGDSPHKCWIKKSVAPQDIEDTKKQYRAFYRRLSGLEVKATEN